MTRAEARRYAETVNNEIVEEPGPMAIENQRNNLCQKKSTTISVTTVALPHAIIVDTREQAPYTFAGIASDAAEGGGPYDVQTTRGTLGSGDYSIAGLEEIVAVERKSKEDLYGTIGQGRDRFVRELERLSEFRFAAVVIEASWDEIVLDPPAHSRLHPKTVHRSIIAWQQRFPRVHWWACGDRRFAEITTLRILMRAGDEHAKAMTDARKAANSFPDACAEVLRLNDSLGGATTAAERRWIASLLSDKAVEVARGYLRSMAGNG